jgi:O-antigen ligase
MDFFSILLCGQWGWLVWKARQNKDQASPSLFRKMGLEKTWAAWVLVVAVGFALHPFELDYALTRIVEFKWVLILYILAEVFQVFLPSRRSLNFILGFIFFIGFTNLFFYFVEWDFISELRYGLHGSFLRAGGFFANPMTFAHSFVLFLCFLLGLFLLDQRNWRPAQKYFALLTLVVASMGLFLTYTRGVWIGFIAGLLVGTFLWRPRYSLICLLIFASTGSLLYQASPQFRWRVNTTLDEAQGESERKMIWKTHFLIFQENPVFGLGYGQNTRQLPKYYERLDVPKTTLVSHAHNQYLHLAAGTGVLGLLIFLMVWSYFLLQGWKVWKHPGAESWDRGAAFGFILAQGTFLFAGLTEANFEHSKVRFAVMLIWAYTIVLAKKYSLLGWKLRSEV